MITDTINKFQTISLYKSEEVKFLQRCDRKYVLPLDKLSMVLEKIMNDYFVMEVKGHIIQEYKTVYFDTEDDYFYMSHHRGKNNRIKIRRREYLNTKERFFEIKRKSLSGIVTKKRIRVQSDLNAPFSELEQEFTNLNTDDAKYQLTPVLSNTFKRITLVSKLMNERITIDVDLKFIVDDSSAHDATNIAIIEVKSNKHAGTTAIRNVLRKLNIHSSGFSKYCMGRAVLDGQLKRNIFKNKLKWVI